MKRSWNRCYDVGLNRENAADDQIISTKNIKELQKENRLLLSVTKEVLEKMLPLMNVTEHIVLLVDSNGYVIYRIGNVKVATKAQAVQLQVGANWKEEHKGTNAIGIALEDQQTNIIIGKDHFFKENQFLSCTASPIYSGEGKLLGVIDISSANEHFSIHAHMLSISIATAIQNKILFEQSKEDHLLSLKELDYTFNLHNKPILSIDKERTIVRANDAARRLLGDDCIGTPFQIIRGFEVETIIDRTPKQFRSVAVFEGHHEKKKANDNYCFKNIIGSCQTIVDVKKVAQKAARYDYNVLITGESGTGKEIFAQSIHYASERKNEPFLAVNCSAIPDSLIESELFGYEAGAFTGADRSGKKGKFVAAHKGTIFLDEIGDMSLRGQAALLRVLQERVVTPVGAVEPKRINTRVIAATHRDLLKEVKKGNFREDLYYRLKEISLSLPSLRDRADISELVEHFLQTEHPSMKLTDDAWRKIKSYHWPGNIRELRSSIVQAIFLADYDVIEARHIQIRTNVQENMRELKTLKELEKEAIESALQESGGNITVTAKILGIGRNTLYRKMKEFQIQTCY
ncbi:hypothetical protein BFG57_12720 [Bacillus solimangrovi]|uniref:Sigma-54 factor interaction domain-containing protein n=1 Tax=Bacillus solimangrovi TaxID=1305675 RepID=A0A1E5LGS1_9BACI|nr:hypothetical protein BFG57_12720 [Bacillus solimangrovi]